ncbi:MAG: class I SAM-dependent methyltransferase [Methylomicrobium sp.]
MSPGDRAIDATVGNGHDTLFLARQVGTDGTVFGFDIQQSALDATRQRLEINRIATPVCLFLANHADMSNRIPAERHGHIKAVMFNLGYLPGGDKTLITQADNTLEALHASLNLLSPNGILSILAYPGHRGGDKETEAIHNWCANLDTTRYRYRYHDANKHRHDTPRLFLIEFI